jgi:hypothetical protein
MKAIKINEFIFSIVFKRLFNKGSRKHFFHVPIEFIETLLKVWEKLEIVWKQSHFVLVFPHNFSFLPNFHACFYNSIETRKMFSISYIYIYIYIYTRLNATSRFFRVIVGPNL